LSNVLLAHFPVISSSLFVFFILTHSFYTLSLSKTLQESLEFMWWSTINSFMHTGCKAWWVCLGLESSILRGVRLMWDLYCWCWLTPPRGKNHNSSEDWSKEKRRNSSMPMSDTIHHRLHFKLRQFLKLKWVHIKCESKKISLG